MNKYYYDKQLNFTLENYNDSPPFSSFLPGVSGLLGKPLWAFYVNRGQGMASFGVNNKNGSIMEFSPANQAYQTVSTKGFRTFIKINNKITEPFSKTGKFIVSPDALKLNCVDTETGIETDVTYFSVPNANFSALVRRVSVKNISSKSAQVEILDGLAEIMPFGVDCDLYKSMSNTLKAWMETEFVNEKAPFYTLRTSVADVSKVTSIDGGNFYYSFVNSKAITPIVDINLIFGQDTSLSTPKEFISNKLIDLCKRKNISTNKIPCGFTPFIGSLDKNETVFIDTVIGYSENKEKLNEIINIISNPDFFCEKEKENKEIINNICNFVSTKTSNPVFDKYIEMCMLDNTLRGGLPLVFDSMDEKIVYHVYNRKHGDLERDYNNFSVKSEFYSQGNGNFRDVTQNRRCDVLLFPQIEDLNIPVFFNLVQADGYNPLAINGSFFQMNMKYFDEFVNECAFDNKDILFDKLSNKFTIGEMLNFVIDKNIKLKLNTSSFVEKLMYYSNIELSADFGEGYWVDHWVYLLDLVESFNSIYPDKLNNLLFDKRIYKFYDSGCKVLPRRKRYVLVDSEVIQSKSVEHDNIKNGYLLDNKGFEVKVNLFEKMLILAINKFSTLDPFGIGIEMEAGKPGWNDSLNGLPAIFGSSVAETLELKRLVEFLKTNKNYDEINLPKEMATFINNIEMAIDEYYLKDKSNQDYKFWDSISDKREKYRESIYKGVDGEYILLNNKKINIILNKIDDKINEGLEKALQYGNGLYPTYLYYDVLQYKNEDGNIIPLDFKINVMPLYLEANVKALKITKDKKVAKKLYDAVKTSNIYDKNLNMYKVNESIENCPLEIGRAKGFTSGWLENESVFLHMEYKYLLEVLKSGLYDEFYSDIKTCFVPFLQLEKYGRSTLENSSFIASSANPDESLWGKGFVARLSGSTVELLSIWFEMFTGGNPFIVQNDKLILKLSPKLPDWIFDEENTASFNFLGTTEVKYYCKNKTNTYLSDSNIKNIEIEFLDGQKVEVLENFIDTEHAIKIRNNLAKSIYITMD